MHLNDSFLSKMLNIGKESESKAKCFFAHTLLPQFIDDNQPPTKRKPFSTFYAQPFNHSVCPHVLFLTLLEFCLHDSKLDLAVPESVASKVQQAIKTAGGELQYAKVHLKLQDVLTGDFFNHYIKTGKYSPRIAAVSHHLSLQVTSSYSPKVGQDSTIPSRSRTAFYASSLTNPRMNVLAYRVR